MIKLTNQSGKPVYVNPDRIDYFATCEIWGQDTSKHPKGTAIAFGSGANRLVVLEEPEELLELVEQ